MGADARLAELGIELPPVAPPAGSYRLARRHGDVVYLAGHGPVPLAGEQPVIGKVGTA